MLYKKQISTKALCTIVILTIIGKHSEQNQEETINKKTMEDKIIISIESYGIKHTSEASNQIESDEFTEIVFNLMCSTGYHRVNIIDGFKHVIRQQDDN